MTNLSIKQAAEHLGVSAKTVRRLIDAGDIAVIRVASCVRIAPADLDGYVDAHREDKAEQR